GGLNHYQYVPNPTGWVDPLGLSCCPPGGSIDKSPTNTGAGSRYKEIISSIDGRKVGEYTALDDGPLSAGAVTRAEQQGSLAATFSGGRYADMELNSDTVAYRAWHPGQAREFGAFWSLEKPAGSLQTRIDSALLPEWGKLRGNPLHRQQATRYTIVIIPKGTRVYIGEVGTQGGAWVGGGSQMLIKDGAVLPGWKVGEGLLK
ncbi:hypothetical protein ACFPTX_17040, partial [Pseudomonas sp. GCM10022188]|nr:hypothetical protein [Pseudomonas oryzagri]